MKSILNKLRKLLPLREIVPDIKDYNVAEIKMRAHLDSDCVQVTFSDGTYIFSYKWIDGVDAKRYGKLWRWHRLYQEQIEQRLKASEE
jgi:hypothetical protein